MAKSSTLKEALRTLSALEDAKLRAANEVRGDDHGANLRQLGTLAKELGAQHQLALNSGRRAAVDRPDGVPGRGDASPKREEGAANEEDGSKEGGGEEATRSEAGGLIT